MRALLYPRFAVPGAVLPREVLSRVPSWGLYPPRLCRPPPSVDPLGEHYAQALVMRVSFFWGSFRGSAGAASHISVIVVKFLTVPLNRQIKVLYHGIESISRRRGRNTMPENQSKPATVQSTQSEERPQILVITGISGAGRSTVANVLEDEGWYVIDNIPPQMLGSLAELVTRDGARVPKVALGIDVRARALFSDLPAAIETLRKSDIDFSMLFLDAKDETIIARYEAQRRPHPLQGEGRVLDGIRAERTLFEGLRLASDRTIDTTGMNVHELARTVREMFAEGADKKLNLTVMSFGFKYGAPSDANYMADMRFIPNPHWVPELRPLTGQDAPVRDYVLEHAGTEEFISNYLAALRPVLEGYRREGKYYATIAIGCTGGKHRSVAVTEELARRLSAFGELNVNVQHRDKGRE